MEVLRLLKITLNRKLLMTLKFTKQSNCSNKSRSTTLQNELTVFKRHLI